MFARSTTVLGMPERIDDGIAMVRDEVLPMVTGMPGCLGLSMLVDRESGHGIVTTSWETQEAMTATAASVKPMRERAVALLGGEAEVQEWEVTVMHRHRPAPEGACTRSTWLRIAPEDADRAHDVFRFGALPRIEELAGFCSAVLMIDRETGLGVTTIVFADRAALEDSREAANAIRTGAAEELDAEVLDVREHELAMAHLHVPELA